MKKLTKILILILSVALVCSALAVAISANSPSVEYTDENGEVITTDSIDEALANVKENGTVTLKSSIDLADTAVIGKPMTLDLNGFKIESSSELAILVTAEGRVAVKGSGAIVADGALMKIEDTDTSNDTRPDVVIDGNDAGKGYGIEINAAGEFFVIGNGCSVDVSNLDAKTSRATDATVTLGDGAYFGSNASTFVVSDSEASPEDGYFLEINSTTTVDLFDTNVITTQNGFNIKDNSRFALTVKGGNYIMEGGNAPQTFFTAKGMSLGVNAVISISASSVFPDVPTVIKASGKIFDTDFTKGISKTISVNATDTRFILTGNAEEAGYVFGGAIPVYIGSGTAVVSGNGKDFSESAKEAKVVTALPGSCFAKASTEYVVPEGSSFVFDPVNNGYYPYTVGTSSTAQLKLESFDTLPAGFGYTYNTPFSNATDAMNGGDIFDAANFTGWLELEKEGDDGRLVYHLPEYVSDGNGGYQLASGVKGAVNSLNVPSYTPPASEGEAGTITFTQQWKSYIDLKVIPATPYFSSNSVVKYSMDITVDEEAGAPGFTLFIMADKQPSGANMGNAIATINGFTVTANGKTVSFEGKNTIHLDLVMNTLDAKTAVYVDGIKVNEVDRGVTYRLRKTLRVYNETGTFNENATIAFDNVQGAIYSGAGAADDFSLDKYNTYLGEQLPELFGPITVNKVTYGSITEAYEAAKKLGSSVELNAPLADGEYPLPAYNGAIITNGYCGDGVKFRSIISGKAITDALGNKVYHYSNEVYGDPISVGFYTGIAEDPMADLVKDWTYIGLLEGEIPESPVANGTTVEGMGYKHSVIGWAKEYIRPSDYATAEEYYAARDAAILTVLEPVSKDGDNRYYAVYDLSPVTAKVITAGGSISFILNQSDLIAYLQSPANGDTLVLSDNISLSTKYTFNFDIKTFTLDLNGHTLDFGTTGSCFFVGSNTSSGAASEVIVNITSSVPGAKIISRSSQTLVNITGKWKKFNYTGANIYLEAQSFVNATTYGWNTGGSNVVTIKGGSFKQLSSDGKAFFGNDGSGNNRANDTVTNVEGITLRGEAPVSGKKLYLANIQRNGRSAVLDAFNFTDCDIVYEQPASSYAVNSWSNNVGRLNFNNCNLVMNMDPIGGFGKIILGEGTTYTSHTSASNFYSYNKTDIDNIASSGKNIGVWYGQGLVGAIAGGSVGNYTYKVVKSADAASNSLFDANGELLDSGLFAKDAYKNITVEDKEYNVLALEFLGWTDNGDGTYTVIYDVQLKIQDAYMVSVTYNSELLINLYVKSELVTYITNDDLDLNDAGDGWYSLSIPVATNRVFTDTEIALNISDNGYTVCEKTAVSVVEYAKRVLLDESQETADRDLAYYMLSYISAAYDYMMVDDNPDAVKEIADIIGDYVPTAATLERPEMTTDASALAGMIDIAVNLGSAPEYIIRVNDQSITTVNVNGTDYEVKLGLVRVSVLRINDFDEAITITVNGAVGTYCFADYEVAIGEADAKLAALLDRLYDYILCAKSYEL